MALTERDKETLKRQLSPEEITYRYQQAVKYFVDGGKSGVFEKAEYDTFQEYNVKRDMQAAAHAWFNMVLTWKQYFDLITAIVGYDLMVQGAIDAAKKAKKNGEDK